MSQQGTEWLSSEMTQRFGEEDSPMNEFASLQANHPSAPSLLHVIEGEDKKQFNRPRS